MPEKSLEDIAKIIEEKIWERHEGCVLKETYKECPNDCCYINATQAIRDYYLAKLPKKEPDVVQTCCTCNCYNAGYNQAIAEMRKVIEEG